MYNPMYEILGMNAPQPPPSWMQPGVGMGFTPPVQVKQPGQGPVPGSNKWFKNQFGPGFKATLPGGFSSGNQAIRKAPPGTIVGL